MKRTGFYTAITLVFLVGLFSCELINPPEDIPSYIRVDTFMITVNDFDQGSASHMMTDIWMSVGGTNLGTFTMPFTVPSLDVGPQTLNIRPGIKLNGISATRIAYPFFKPVIMDVELVPGEILQIIPVSEYKDVCFFAFIEEFEDPGVKLLYAPHSDTSFMIQKDVVKEGRSSGAIFLTKDQKDFEAFLDEDLELPENASPVLIEFDYKNNNEFQIGMYLIEDGVMEWRGLVKVRPSEIWKRMYVDLGQTATLLNETELYRVTFLASYQQEDSLTTAEIYLDNIKLIHYK